MGGTKTSRFSRGAAQTTARRAAKNRKKEVMNEVVIIVGKARAWKDEEKVAVN